MITVSEWSFVRQQAQCHKGLALVIFFQMTSESLPPGAFSRSQIQIRSRIQLDKPLAPTPTGPTGRNWLDLGVSQKWSTWRDPQSTPRMGKSDKCMVFKAPNAETYPFLAQKSASPKFHFYWVPALWTYQYIQLYSYIYIYYHIYIYIYTYIHLLQCQAVYDEAKPKR